MRKYEKIYQNIFSKELVVPKKSLTYTKLSENNEKLIYKNNQNVEIEKKIGNYILGKKLGQGTFGIVVMAKHDITGENVAIKILDKEKISRESDKTRLEREIKIMKSMYHNNIVHLYNVIENVRELFIVMEYISGKELFDYIINKKHLDEIESCKFYQQIISGIEYLGKTKVAHRDLKPENLLLDSKKNIKIVDFGLSNTYFQNELLSTACGSPCYAAPEMLSGDKYSGINIDIWSSGIVLYAMLCGYLPFEDNNNPRLYKKIIKGDFETPDFLSSSAVDLLHHILNVDPNKRYTIDQIKEHPWFNQINPKLNMSEGLLIDYYIVPFDEEIISKMVNEYSFNEQQIKINLLMNKHNNITTTYYLILKKKIRSGKKTIGDMTSELFIEYINDEKNLTSSYDFNMNSIIIDRVLKKSSKNIISKIETKIDIRKTESNNEPQFKYYENNITKLQKNSKNSKKNNLNVKEYNTLNKEKYYETIDMDKENKQNININNINNNNTNSNSNSNSNKINNSDKKVSFKDKRNKIKGNNLLTSYDTNNTKVYKKRDNYKNNYNKKKVKSTRDKNFHININNNNIININNKKNALKTSKKNLMNHHHKCFYTTFTENNIKNLSQTNEDLSIDETNNNKKIINRISLLKESIIKSMTNKNINKANKNNNSNINISSNFSPPHPHCFSNKNFFTKIKPSSALNNQNSTNTNVNINSHINNTSNNEVKYKRIINITESTKEKEKEKERQLSSSKERYKKIKLPTTPYVENNARHNRGQTEIIRIIQRIKTKTKDKDTNTMIDKSPNNRLIFNSRSNFAKNNLCLNSASRMSRTPNNTGREITNKIIFEHNINSNGLNKKIYEINFGDNKSCINKNDNENENEKNENGTQTITDNNNNIINNNNNNINIHINLTNIYKNIHQSKDCKDESLCGLKKNTIKIMRSNDKNIKKINEIMRQNKFIDSIGKNRKFFIDTSVSLDKRNDEKSRKRRIESENKDKRFLINRVTNKQELITNFRNAVEKLNELRNNNIRRETEDTSIQRKEKDIRYLKIKSKNRKFNEIKINKMNSLKTNYIFKNNEKSQLSNLITSINLDKNNLIRIKKKNSISNKNFKDNRDKNINHMSLNVPSFYCASNNNSNIKIKNNSNNKSFPKKPIYNTKQIFKSINTDFYYPNNEKLTTTGINFYPTKNSVTNNNIINANSDFCRDKILSNKIQNSNIKNFILSERNTFIKNNIMNKKRNEIKKNITFYKPFDLNSLIYVNKNEELKEMINKLFNSKNIKYNEMNNKYKCFNKKIKFELNIINVNELNGAYIIKSFQKPVNGTKIKNVYNNTIFKLINNIK